MNPHLNSLGAQELTREQFITALHDLREQTVQDSCFSQQELSFPIQQEMS